MKREDETTRKCIIFVQSGGCVMGQLAFLKMFLLVSAIDKHWEFINDQISRTFRGERTKVKDLGK
jgi:hypothetical protein